MRRTLVALAGITLLLGACSTSTPNGSASPTGSASPAGVSIKLTEFDFLGSATPWKMEWAPAVHTFHHRCIFARGISGLAPATVLLRRTALAAFPRATVAPLAGTAWLAFLDRSYDGQEFSQGAGRLLISAPYRRAAPGDDEVEALVGVARRWIRRHHV